MAWLQRPTLASRLPSWVRKGLKSALRGAPVTVVAKGEFTVVHQKMHRLSRNACDAESSKNSCSTHSTDHTHLWNMLVLDAVICLVRGVESKSELGTIARVSSALSRCRTCYAISASESAVFQGSSQTWKLLSWIWG